AGVPTLVIARTDADSAKLLTSDVDERDHPFIDRNSRTPEGFYTIKPENRMEYCIERGKAFAPYADLIWMETSNPDLAEAKQFIEGVRKDFPNKMCAYNCSPSFNWKGKLDDDTIAKFQRELGAMGFKYQFITLAGFHSLNYHTFMLARGYKERQMAAYSELQEAEFAAEKLGYTATRHQREVGTGYFDAVSLALTGGTSSTTAMSASTETDQFDTADETDPTIMEAAE
ncbi:MAG: isocitrate lyase, partial [Pseudomonadota bacterium]